MEGDFDFLKHKSITHYDTAKHLMSLLGHHATECTTSSKCHILTQRPVIISHILTVLSSEPETIHNPVGSIENARTYPV